MWYADKFNKFDKWGQNKKFHKYEIYEVFHLGVNYVLSKWWDNGTKIKWTIQVT